MKIIRTYPIIKSLFSVMAVLFLAVSCSNDERKDDPTVTLKAVFSVDNTAPLIDTSVEFKNESLGVDDSTTCIWDFGDGQTTMAKNASHIYEEIGNYIVTLTVRSGNQESRVSQEIAVSQSNTIAGRASLKNALQLLDGKIMVCAHRGNHSEAPENSLQSIRDAIKNGVEMVELDVRQTKDGELVLMHDESIDRTTNGSGKINDFLLEELGQFNLYKENGTLTSEKIPTLKEVLKLSRGKIYIDLDIDKKADFNKVFPLVSQYGMLKQVLFYSSEHSVVQEMLNTSIEDVLEMAIVRNDNDFERYANLDLSVVQFNVDDDDIAQNILTKPWYVFRNAYVNSNGTPLTDNYAQLQEVLDINGSIVQTDYPLLIKNRLQSLNLND